MSHYNFFPARQSEVPILVSVPHCGIEFPAEIKDEYDQALIGRPDDTDWFVDRLYDFAPDMGMPMITAKYSRWVIDLNRNPDQKPLYADGRIITALCPTTTFLGEPLYLDKRTEVSNEETARRLELYFWDYHDRVRQELERLKTKFGSVLLWDCHSIRQFVATVHSSRFPDLILGDANGQSANAELSQASRNVLKDSPYSVSHNYPFKGGYITRHFGKPGAGQHALQLEMSKTKYMDDSEMEYHEERAEEMKALLKKTFSVMIDRLSSDSIRQRSA